MPKTAVIIAYDGLNENQLRFDAYWRVTRHLEDLGWPIFLAVDTHRPYRLALAVNRCVRETPCDVFLLNYADVLVPLRQIRHAVMEARKAPGQVFAFDQYVHVEEPDGREFVIADAPANACMAIQRQAFLEVGGYHEGFVGWAMEDREFNDRCGAKWPPRRVKGRLEHLWHGERREDGSALETSEEQVLANRALYRELG